MLVSTTLHCATFEDPLLLLGRSNSFFFFIVTDLHVGAYNVKQFDCCLRKATMGSLCTGVDIQNF